MSKIKMIFEGVEMTFKSVPDIERRLKLSYLFTASERQWILNKKNEGVIIHACVDPYASDVLQRTDLIMATNKETLETMYRLSCDDI